MDNAREAAEQRTAGYVKQVNQEKNKAIEELNAKYAANLSSKLEENSAEWDRKYKQCEEERDSALKEVKDIKSELIKSVADLATSKPKLMIHSALYGAGGARDVDVTERIQQESRNGLAIVVNNDLAPYDPAKFVQKRIEVEYSYGDNPTRRKVVVQEHGALILPQEEDFAITSPARMP
jgi:hypothetical protein